MTSVNIPNSVNFIDGNAFYGCSSLKSITLPISISKIDYVTFAYCSQLSSIVIPSTVTMLSQSAFRDCANLTSISIPSSVTSISNGVFYNCVNLNNVTIPASVASIDYGAFGNCISLKAIYNYNKIPIKISSVFINVDKTNCTLFVPTGSKATYQAATEWKDFTNIVEFDPTSAPIIQKPNIGIASTSSNGLLDIKGLENSANISIYNLQGREVLTRTVNPNEQISICSFPRGVYIVKVTSREGAFVSKFMKE